MPRDPYEYFRIEARELIDQLAEEILRLERGPDPELIARLLRLAHTLKGAAGVVALPDIADGAHTLEDVLAPHRAEDRPVPSGAITELLAIVDRMSSHLAALGVAHTPDSPKPASDSPKPASDSPGPAEDSPGPAEAPEPGPAAAPQPAEAYSTANTADLDELLDAVTQAGARLASTRQAMTAMAELRHMTELLCADLTPRSGERQVPAAGRTTRAARSVAETLRTRLADLQRESTQALHHADRELRHAREVAERMRLVSVGSIFTALHRAARDVALAQHKNVVFTGHGGDVRLGPLPLREIHHAMLHVVRNAVAHGIETEEIRRAGGKALAGSIAVEVVRRGRHIVFTCRDDGAGFDLHAARQAIGARQPQSDPTQLSDDALIQTLLHGGISTSKTVTEASGRGVGLDVLRAAAASMGGEVSIRTEAGRGATVELAVPYALAALDALTVEANGRLVTIPLDAVRRSIRVHPRDIAHATTGDSIVVDGQAITFIALSRLLAEEPDTVPPAYGWPAVIIDGKRSIFAVGVDRLVGHDSVIFRPLPPLAMATSVVMGASLDAEGNPRLVLDPDALVDQVRHISPTVAEPATPSAAILIVDDSLTTRMLEQAILESAGYMVDLATNGEEALQRARRGRYGLFLVDVEMPVMDGFTFVESIRADPQLCDTPAILVTSCADPADRARGQRAGADDYLIKSEFDQTYLLERIQTLLTR